MPVERWRLLKHTRGVRCVQSPHPLGVELRVIVDPDDLRRSEVFRDPARADAASAGWRRAFEEKGWRPAPPRFARPALERAVSLTRDAQARVPGDNAIGHVLSYRLKVMREALEVALADDVSLDEAARERRLLDAMTELARADRGPEGQALVKPILDALGGDGC
jgi:chorismate mutase